jgi:hypothetical protein
MFWFCSFVFHTSLYPFHCGGFYFLLCSFFLDKKRTKKVKPKANAPLLLPGPRTGQHSDALKSVNLLGFSCYDKILKALYFSLALFTGIRVWKLSEK